MADRLKSREEVLERCKVDHPEYTDKQLEAYLIGYFDAMLDEHMYKSTEESIRWNSY